RYENAWGEWDRVMSENVPRLMPIQNTTPMNALRFYPHEMAGHLGHNLHTALYAPAIFLGLLHRTVFLIALLVTLLVVAKNSRAQWASYEREHRGFILAWSATALFIMPLLIVYRVANRYLVSLIPSCIFLTMWCGITV